MGDMAGAGAELLMDTDASEDRLREFVNQVRDQVEDAKDDLNLAIELKCTFSKIQLLVSSRNHICGVKILSIVYFIASTLV